MNRSRGRLLEKKDPDMTVVYPDFDEYQNLY